MAKPGGEGNGTQGSVEGISELLRCYICMERLTDASVCPNCSILGCYSCIRRWVTNNRQNCPHCRQPLVVRDLIKIPIFDDLGKMLDTLKTAHQATSTSERQDTSKCPTHRQNKFSVYCESCKKCICHECALWGEHKGHSFKPIEFVFERQKAVCLEEKTKLNKAMRVAMHHLQQVEKRMELVKAGKQKAKRDINCAVEKMYSHLEDQCRAKLQILADCKQNLKTRAVGITNISCTLEKEMTCETISSLVNEHGELQAEIVAKLQKLSTEPGAIPNVGEFVNGIVPKYDSAVFKIKSFRDLQNQGEPFYSEPLSVYGMRWRLKVYPNGHRDDMGRYLGVFVELQDGFDKTSTYQYCIEMLYQCSTRYPHSNFKKEYASDFAEGESWGYGKFYKLSKLEEDGYLRENTLVLRFSVRALTYLQKSEDLVCHIDHLENQLSSTKERIQSVQQQMASLKNEQGRSGRSHGSPSHSSFRHPATQGDRPPPRTRQLAPPEVYHRHSYSAPAPQDHHSDRERDRREPEDVRRVYTSASQQPLRNPSHRQGQSSPKHSPYLTQPGPTESPRFSPSEPQMVSYGRRRRSHDDPESQQKLTDQRRNSADTTIGGHPYRSYALPRTLSQSHQELHHVHEHEGRDERSRHKRGTMFSTDKAPPNARYSRRRITGISSSMRSLEPGGHRSAHTEPLNRSNTFHEFKSSDSDTEDGGSETYELNPSDIQITVEDNNSSTTTLVAFGSPQKTGGGGSVDLSGMGSQEQFDETEIMPLSTLAEGIPMSSQSHYYEHLGIEPEPVLVLTRHDSHQGLSQPSLAPRSKQGRHRMSLSDLSSLANSSTNLTRSQYLSQSVVEVPRYSHRGEVPGQRLPDSRPRHAQSYSHSNLHRLQSDPYLNAADGPPGQQRSILGAMSRAKEEVKQRERNQQQHHHQQGGHSSSSPRTRPLQRRQKAPHSPQTQQQLVPSSQQTLGPHSQNDKTDRSRREAVSKSKLEFKVLEAQRTGSPTEALRSEVHSTSTNWEGSSGSGSDDTVTVTPPTQTPVLAGGVKTSSLTSLHELI